MTTEVAKPSAIVTHMSKRARRGRALMGGTLSMREAGPEFLPKFEREEDAAYRARRDASWLFNGLRKTVRDMAGFVFTTPIEAVDAPEIVDDWLANVDREGRDFSVFLKQVFEDALSGPGVSYIMADAPRREGVVTVAQARAANLRPFLKALTVEDVLGWRTETVGSQVVLTQIRIAETVEEQDPKDEFGSIEVEQVRVLDLEGPGGTVRVRLYRKDADKKEEWLLHEEFNTGQTEIMVAPFYACRTGFMTGEPLLDDLADVNIAHWQSQSDQRNILRAARVPILHISGRTSDDGEVVIGATTAIMSGDTDARLEWVEHTGAAIGAGRQDLKDLEFQMEAHGLQLLVTKPSAQSATGEARDAMKETSTLSALADALQDTAERVLGWMAELGGVPFEPVVAVNKEFGLTAMTAQEFQVLLTAVNTGNLSRSTFLAECARRGMISSDVDIEDEIERIEDEGGDLMVPPLAPPPPPNTGPTDEE